jgi:hypothetical protein
MSETKLKYIGPRAKTGIPETNTVVERGGEASFDSSLAAELLKSGNWEEVKKSSSHPHTTKTEKEDK